MFFYFELLTAVAVAVSISTWCSTATIHFLVETSNITNDISKSFINIDSLFCGCLDERTAEALCEITTL